MERTQLEHALRASKEVTGETDFIVIGSCSVLGQHPIEGEYLTRTTGEIDIYPRDHPEKASLLNAIGYMSTFEKTHGFYVDAVGPETATVPPGWQDRLVRVSNENTNHSVGWCLDKHDLAVSKVIAGRGKDLEFLEELLVGKLVDPKIILERLLLVEGLHTQVRNMAHDQLEQVIVNAERSIKRQKSS